jgi:hypothetical protein
MIFFEVEIEKVYRWDRIYRCQLRDRLHVQ